MSTHRFRVACRGECQKRQSPVGFTSALCDLSRWRYGDAPGVRHRRRIGQLYDLRSACLIHSQRLCKTYRGSAQCTRDVGRVREHAPFGSCEDPPRKPRFSTLHCVIFTSLGEPFENGSPYEASSGQVSSSRVTMSSILVGSLSHPSA